MNAEIIQKLNELDDLFKKEGKRLISVDLTTLPIDTALNAYPEMESCGFSSN